MKTSWLSLFCLNVFNFGNQKVTQFVLFECKYFFSIIFFYFHKSNRTQDRYHTHAFNAISFKFFGEYDEFVLNKETNAVTVEKRNTFFKYFPKNRYHKIGNSNGCLTMLISGKWEDTWEETLDSGEKFTYFWNRKIK